MCTGAKMKFFILQNILIALVIAAEEDLRDPVTDQLVIFKERTKGPIGVLTTSAGEPVPYEEAINTLNKPLANNNFFMDVITHIARERIPERVVHALGTGAFGYFEVTHDITRICDADFLKKIGQKTPVAVRFSSSRGSRGTQDLDLDVRGFAIKFYTREGNLDLIGFNTPMYLINEPLLVHTVIHTSKRNPVTNQFDRNMFFDFATLAPETMHMLLLVFAGRGLPASYRHTPCFPVHTYQVHNKDGKLHFVRFHILPDDGIKSLTSEEASKILAMDSDYLTRDLYTAIGNGNFPSYTVNVQILTMDDIKRVGFEVFDSTRVIPLKDFPLHKVGKIVLNRNAKNFFTDIEQMAFCPGNLVRGIDGSPDKLFESRRIVYRDAHVYRLGVNFNKIPVNCPFQAKTYTYNRDGVPHVGDNEEDTPNYYPNTFHGPIPYMEHISHDLIKIIEKKPRNFDQAADLYENELTTDERKELIKNFIFALGQVGESIRNRVIQTFKTIHKDLGYRVARGFNSTMI